MYGRLHTPSTAIEKICAETRNYHHVSITLFDKDFSVPRLRAVGVCFSAFENMRSFNVLCDSCINLYFILVTTRLWMHHRLSISCAAVAFLLSPHVRLLRRSCPRACSSCYRRGGGYWLQDYGGEAVLHRRLSWTYHLCSFNRLLRKVELYLFSIFS